MTLADFVREYLETRRKRIEEQIRSQQHNNWGNDDPIYTLMNDKVDTDLDGSDISSLFSNGFAGKQPNVKANSRSFGVSQSTRITTLPDGRIQSETIMKDGRGNEERKVSYQKDGKQYTVITRRDPSGVEHVQETVTDVTKDNDFVNPSAVMEPSDSFAWSQHPWKGSFFKFPVDDQVDSDNMEKYLEQQMDEIVRNFSFPRGFNPFSDSHRGNKWQDFSLPSKDEDNTLSNEARKLIERADKDMKRNKKYKGGNTKENWGRQMDTMFKNIFTKQYSTVFAEIDARNKIELPREESPFDKYVPIDDDEKQRQQQRRQTLNQAAEVMRKLTQHLDSLKGNTDRRIDINELQTVFPSIKPAINEFKPQLNDTTATATGWKVIKESMLYSADGKTRKETVRKDDLGNLEKNVTYKSGDKSYTVITKINSQGEEVKKECSSNLSDDQLSEFASKWDKRFASDFNKKDGSK